MTHLSTIARDSAQHCEAKKHALRQTQDGIVVAFVLHPNDVPASLQLAPLGTRYMLALVEIGDDEQPKEVLSENARMNKEPAPSPDPSVRAPTRFSEKLYSEQAGILCKDVKFRRFLAEHDKAPDIAIYDIDMATDRIRQMCDVKSRAEILPGTRAEQRWLLLVSAFRAWDLAPSVGAA